MFSDPLFRRECWR